MNLGKSTNFSTLKYIFIIQYYSKYSYSVCVRMRGVCVCVSVCGVLWCSVCLSVCVCVCVGVCVCGVCLSVYECVCVSLCLCLFVCVCVCVCVVCVSLCELWGVWSVCMCVCVVYVCAHALTRILQIMKCVWNYTVNMLFTTSENAHINFNEISTTHSKKTFSLFLVFLLTGWPFWLHV